jgi:glycosyltransferase involved in cell wall biosynthesis
MILKKNVHLVLNNFKNDSRVLKETLSISKFNFFKELNIIALHEGNLLEQEELDKKRKVFRLKLLSRKLPKSILFQILKYIEWAVKIFLMYINKKVDVVHCHDLNTLPVGVLFKLFKSSKLIYDAHELETETCNLKGFRKKMTKILERRLIYFPDKIITVSDSIANWYFENYNCSDISVIKNIPMEKEQLSKSNDWLKDKLNIKKTDILFIYLGGFSKGRGIENLLDIFSKLPIDKHVLFMGYGVLEPYIKRYESKYFNIHRLDAVPSNKVLEYTSCADVGIYLMENACKNHFYSLPNKVFEYLKSGVPVITSNFPDQRKIVEKYDCGWVLKEEKNSIVDFINNISIDMISSKKKGVQKFNKENSWDNEAIKLKKIYGDILNING